MTSALWYSPDGVANAEHLLTKFSSVFTGMAEIDRLGHAVLEQAITTYRGLPWETTLGLALLRRAVTQFGGIRYLCEHSSIQPSTLVARAHFETLLAVRYLVYGTKRFISGMTASSAKGRELRARFYRVEELRREIYRRQAAIDGRFGGRKLKTGVIQGIKDEIVEKIDFLEKHFPAQQKQFGPLLCFPDPKNAKRRINHFDQLAWFSFGFGKKKRQKVKNIRSLAIEFGWQHDYEMLYEAFSGFAHVRGLHHDVEVEPGNIAVRVPHAPDDFELVAYFACQRQLFMLSCLSKAFHPQSRSIIQMVDLRIRPALAVLQSHLPLGTT